MATRTFNLNTEPHQAVIGAVTLLFEPEAVGSDFMSAYADLKEAQARFNQSTKGVKASSTRHAKDPDYDAAAVASLAKSMRDFVRSFLLPKSQDDFDGLRVPDRILVQLIEFLSEIYGGGSGNPDEAGGTSTG